MRKFVAGLFKNKRFDFAKKSKNNAAVKISQDIYKKYPEANTATSIPVLVSNLHQETGNTLRRNGVYSAPLLVPSPNNIGVEKKDITNTSWDNKSEVTTVFAGDGIAITDNGSGQPLITATGGKASSNKRMFFTFTETFDQPVPFPADSIKLTLIGRGGNGSSKSNSYSYAGAGGGAGGSLVLYLNNLHAIDLFYTVFFDTNRDVTMIVGTIDSPHYTKFAAHGGADATLYSGVPIGGVGGGFSIIPGTDYPEYVTPEIDPTYINNYTYIGINGADGGDGFYTSFNNGSGAQGGANALFGGAGKISNFEGKSSGNGVPNSGGGGSGAGAASTATPGVGGSGIIILEY